jgi:hypothetical protein
VQYKSDKARAFKRKQGTIGGVDLMIVDIPEERGYCTSVEQGADSGE